jgi:transcriptional regulator with XRE-family HTH domain
MASIPSQAIPELQRLGERLRHAREQQGISREELAERLHLGTEQLVALETADSARLHEPVFVIAQARRLAAALNLGIEPEISALRRCGMAGGGGAPSPAATAPASPGRQPPQAPPASPAAAVRPAAPAGRGWLPWLAAPAAVLLAVLALLTLRRPPSPSPAPAPATSSTTPAPTVPAPAAAAETPAAAGQYSLRALRSQETSWVEVRDSSGHVLFRGRLEGEKSFPLGAGLQVLAGRPDLVAGGLAGVPPQPLGSIDQVNWRRIQPSARTAQQQDVPAAQQPDVPAAQQPGEAPTAPAR